MRRLLVTASVVPSSPILVTMMEALSPSETSALTTATRRNVPHEAILLAHSYFRQPKLKLLIIKEMTKSRFLFLEDSSTLAAIEDIQEGGFSMYHFRRVLWNH
jgi:hypothetical protein